MVTPRKAQEPLGSCSGGCHWCANEGWLNGQWLGEWRRAHTVWSVIQREILERDARTCASCGLHQFRDDVAVEVDHIVELRDGGSFADRSNLQVLCVHCHQVKTTLRTMALSGIPEWCREIQSNALPDEQGARATRLDQEYQEQSRRAREYLARSANASTPFIERDTD